MKRIKPRSIIPGAGLLLLALVCFSGCQNPPISDFTYSPSANCELGENVTFINNSLDAVSFHWDFGNGKVSNLKNPIIKFEKAGTYNVTLTASNQLKSSSSSEEIIIHAPTILGIYIRQEGTDRALSSCNVKVYESEADLNEKGSTQLAGFTNNLGYIEFENLEDQAYYIYAYKTDNMGLWSAEASTEPLEFNKTNIQTLICNLFE